MKNITYYWALSWFLGGMVVSFANDSYGNMIDAMGSLLLFAGYSTWLYKRYLDGKIKGEQPQVIYVWHILVAIAIFADPSEILMKISSFIFLLTVTPIGSNIIKWVRSSKIKDIINNKGAIYERKTIEKEISVDLESEEKRLKALIRIEELKSKLKEIETSAT